MRNRRHRQNEFNKKRISFEISSSEATLEGRMSLVSWNKKAEIFFLFLQPETASNNPKFDIWLEVW